MNGQFIVLYGINNLGKSTQAHMLVDALNARGIAAEYLKYPVYDLSPSGPLINAYLREGNPFGLSAREAQILYTLNRTQYEPLLHQKLADGITVIAEDYIGTGLAWGGGAGVDMDFLATINSHLLPEDRAFLFEGQRFTEGIESSHKHEQDDELTSKVKDLHQMLAHKHGWTLINANQDKEVIHHELLQHLGY